MFNKVFRSCFFTAMTVLVLSFCLIFGVLFDYFEAQMFNELNSEIMYISQALQNEGISYIDSFTSSDKRITLISKDGEVLADTRAEASQLENHSNRSEIRDALSIGSGMSSRYSNTLMQKTLYCAKKLDDGSILRISTTQNSIIVILLGILQPIIAIIVLALIISLFISRKVSKSIIKPINSIDTEHPDENDTYEELTPLLKRLSLQKKTIEAQIKQAEKQQEEFKLITENMNEGLLIIDKDFKVLSHNSAAIRLLEIENPKNGSVLTFNRSKGFRRVIEKSLTGQRCESTVSNGDKTYNLIANPVFENDKIIGSVIVIIDITESAKREHLRQEFTSNVSHELKTPLTSISGFAEMMKSGGMSEETVIDFSSSIYDEAQRLISLVSDIMKISALDEGAVTAVNDKADLYDISQKIAKRLSPIAQKNNIAINVIGSSAVIYGNEKILDDMIFNLCDNAIKYNKENGLVDIIINTTESAISLSVRDNGIGIPQSEQSRIFERFYRVDKSHSKLIGGTGLGLAIVKHAAMYHNAEISLDSTPGVGTCITITFKNTLSSK